MLDFLNSRKWRFIYHFDRRAKMQGEWLTDPSFSLRPNSRHYNGVHFSQNIFRMQFVKNAGRIIIRVENAGRNAHIFFSGLVSSLIFNKKNLLVWFVNYFGQSAPVLLIYYSKPALLHCAVLSTIVVQKVVCIFCSYCIQKFSYVFWSNN